MTQEKTVLKSGALNLPFLYIIALLTATCSVSYAADLPVPQPVPDDAVTDPITDYFLH